MAILCKFFAVSRSGYYAFVRRLGRPEKDAALAEAIAQQRERSFRTYGYRRMWLLAMKQQKKAVAAELQLRSDQGFQYTSRAYFNLTKSYGITPPMSRRGNPYDNAMAENFFSILKTECIYRHKPAAFSEANEMMDRYILFYNHERIQLKTGEAPLARRLSY